jgi:hypothetical protein
MNATAASTTSDQNAVIETAMTSQPHQLGPLCHHHIMCIPS